MSLPGFDPSRHNIPSKSQPAAHHAPDAADLMPRIFDLAGVQYEWAKLANVKRALADYCRSASDRGFTEVEQRVMAAVVLATVPSPRETFRSVHDYGRGLRQGFALVNLMMKSAWKLDDLKKLELAGIEIAKKNQTARIEIRRGLLDLSENLDSVDAWVGLLEASAKHISKACVMPAVVRNTSEWYGGVSAAAEARAAFAQYLISRGRDVIPYLSDISQAREYLPAALADRNRARLLRLAAQEPTIEDALLLKTLRFIAFELGKDPSLSTDVRDILSACEKNPSESNNFLIQLAQAPVRNRFEFLKVCAPLARQGYPCGLFFGPLPAFLAEECDYALDKYKTDDHIKRMAAGLAAFVNRLPHHVRFSASSDIIKILTTHHRLETIRDPRQAEKLGLVLEARNLSAQQRELHMSTIRQFNRVLLELTTHSLILTAVHTNDVVQRDKAKDAYASSAVASADNPPFSLSDTQSGAVFMRQVKHGYRRMNDGYYGFWKHTYPMRHSPISRNCYFDDLAWALGKGLKVVVAKDFNRFPGRGRIVEGLDRQRIFAQHPADAHRAPYHTWRKHILREFDPSATGISPHFGHPIDDMDRTRYLYMRGLRAVTVPSNRAWEMYGEHMTYAEYNHHFDPSGVYLAIGVPTRVLWSFVDAYAVPYKSGDPFPYAMKLDVCNNPPTIENLKKRCREMKTNIGVLNLGSGSCYGGGFCNAPDPKSAPTHVWERKLDRLATDGFDHVHKYFIQQDDQEIRNLLQLHNQLYALFVAGSARFDLMKIAEHIYAWGQNDELAPVDQAESWRQTDDDDLGSNFGEYLAQAPMVLRDVVDDEQIDLEPGAVAGTGWQSRSTRMLKKITMWMTECRQAQIPKDQVPVLVLGPTMLDARAPASPFIIEATTGTVWRHKKPPLHFREFDGSVPDEITDWWISDVSPFAHSAHWVMPKVVAPQNYLDQMRAFGAI